MSRILQCRCGVTVMDDGSDRVNYFTGTLHDCGDDALSLMDALADDALRGDEDAVLLLPEAVNWWLACKR